MLPSCVKLLDHYMTDSQGGIYKVDALHEPPKPGFNTGIDPEQFEQKFLKAVHKTPRADLAALLHRRWIDKHGVEHNPPDVGSFYALSKPPYSLSIALVDMTGDKSNKSGPNNKFFHPQYAAYYDKDAIYPASLAKIAPIYAAHQLKFDAIQKATLAPTTASADAIKLKKWVFEELRNDWKAKALKSGEQPVLEDLLKVNDAATKNLVFTELCTKRMKAITHPDGFGRASINNMNEGMTFLMTRMHAPYMGSAFLQSGLCDANSGGLWMWEAWGEKWRCGGRPPQLYPKQSSTEVMAWSAATYLTLLAQRRLVSPETSDEIADILRDGDTNWLTNAFIAKFPASELVDLKVWGKEGAWTKYASEALLIERTNSSGKAFRYVVACLLSSDVPVSEYPVALAETDPLFREVWDVLLRSIVESIIPALDGVIVANNP